MLQPLSIPTIFLERKADTLSRHATLEDNDKDREHGAEAGYTRVCENAADSWV